MKPTSPMRHSRVIPAVRTSHAAFSLVELLAVIAIISILAVGLSSSLTSSGRSGQQLETGIVILSNALAQARSESIARNAPVQLRLITNDPQDATAAGRVFSLWMGQRDVNGNLAFGADGKPVYEPLTAWKRLPASVSVIGAAAWPDAPTLPGPNAFDAGANLENSLGGVAYKNRTVDVMLVEFSPSGGLRLPKVSGATSSVLLANALDLSGGSNLSSRAGDVKATGNWRQISIANLTGQIRVVSP